MIWKTSKREFYLSERTLVMGILNLTPDSFSDGGKISSVDEALRVAEKMIADGADIIDIGGESTRPESARVSVDEECARVIPAIAAILKNFDVAVSIDTSKAEVARRALEAGAEIVNDISGLRFDEDIADVAAQAKAGIVVMHLRGIFETMHKQEPVPDIITEVEKGLKWSIDTAREHGIGDEHIALDIGLGFSKTFEQNLELMAKLSDICDTFAEFPVLVGSSRKSFIGRMLGDVPVDKRLHGSLATVALSVWNGAKIVRVHDVKETVEIVRTVESIKGQK